MRQAILREAVSDSLSYMAARRGGGSEDDLTPAAWRDVVLPKHSGQWHPEYSEFSAQVRQAQVEFAPFLPSRVDAGSRETGSPDTGTPESNAQMRADPSVVAKNRIVEDALRDFAARRGSAPDDQLLLDIWRDYINPPQRSLFPYAEFSARIKERLNQRPSKKRGRRANEERRAAIHDAIAKHGNAWRDHLSEIFEHLSQKAVALGSFEGREIDLGDGQKQRVHSWEDLGLADGEERGQIWDILRKYVV